MSIEHSMWVEYEKLDDMDTLKDMVKFLGLEIDEGWITYMKDVHVQTMNRRAHLSWAGEVLGGNDTQAGS